MNSVALMVSTLNSGGAEKQAVLLSTIISRHFHTIVIVLYGDSPEYIKNIEMLENNKIQVFRLTGNLLIKSYKILSILKHNNVSVLLNYLTMPNVIGSLIGNFNNLKVYNGIRNSRLPFIKMIFERFVHNHLVEGTIFNCYSGAKYFESIGFNSAKNIVIPNGFPNITSPINRDEKEIKNIVTVGRFVKQKDYLTLVRSVSLLRRKDFRLFIVGYGKLENKVRKWIEQYNLSNISEIYIKPNNVVEIEKNADIYLSTSLFEGTSNSIMEAMNFSLPVVATNVGDNNYLVRDGENGFLHSVGDVEGIATSLNILLDSSDLRNQMGKKGNEILRSLYSMELFEKRYLSLLTM